MRPQAVGRECNASDAKRPVGVQGEAAPERSPWAAAGRKIGAAPSSEPPPRSGPVSERTLSGCLLDGTMDARTSFPRPRYTP